MSLRNCLYHLKLCYKVFLRKYCGKASRNIYHPYQGCKARFVPVCAIHHPTKCLQLGAYIPRGLRLSEVYDRRNPTESFKSCLGTHPGNRLSPCIYCGPTQPIQAHHCHPQTWYKANRWPGQASAKLDFVHRQSPYQPSTDCGNSRLDVLDGLVTTPSRLPTIDGPRTVQILVWGR